MGKTAVSLRELESRVGQEVGVSPWVEVTQQRIDTFAKAIDDFQWIHVDPARAKGSPFGGTIAHGFLTLSLLSHLSERTFGKVTRSFTLPQDVDEAKAEAKFRDGVLELTLPKKAAAARKQISIQ